MGYLVCEFSNGSQCVKQYTPGRIRSSNMAQPIDTLGAFPLDIEQVASAKHCECQELLRNPDPPRPLVATQEQAQLPSRQDALRSILVRFVFIGLWDPSQRLMEL